MNVFYKTCTGCEKTKIDSEFSNHCRKKDGKREQCKTCCNEAQRYYSKENREKELKRVRQWAKENREKIRIKHRQWQRENKDKVNLWNTLARLKRKNKDYQELKIYNVLN